MNKKQLNHSKYIKLTVSVLIFILVIGFSVIGTLAWLTSQPQSVHDTFTSAKLFNSPSTEFTVWEHEVSDVNNDGMYELSANVKNAAGNTAYSILPGVNIPKDPTVTITNLLEDAYLYIRVTENTLPATLTYVLDPCWTPLPGHDDIYVYTHNGSNLLEEFTDEHTMDINIIADKVIIVSPGHTPDANAIDPYKLIFEAYMVQAMNNGANAAEAWANTYGNAAH